MALNVWDRAKYAESNNEKDRIEILAKSRHQEQPPPEVEPHHQWAPYAGSLLWTGPDGNRDYRPKLFNDWQVLGIGDNSPEKTLSSTYISRAPADQPFGRSRSEMIGEIGWFYKNYSHTVDRVYPEYMER
ncbi:hypothetical protein ACF0H5_015299 [Mactra antiquata]